MGAIVLLPATQRTRVEGLAFADGRTAVLCGNAVITGSLSDPDSWAVLCPGEVDVAVHGDRVYTVRGDRVVAVDAGSGRQVGEYGADPHPRSALAISPDGEHVAAGDYQTVSVWETRSGAPRRGLGCGQGLAPGLLARRAAAGHARL